jgi:subtilisin family serine protease
VAGAGLVAATLSTAAPAVAAPNFGEASANAAAPAFTDGRYIVSLAAPPAAAYTGGIGSYQATKPKRGEKFDPDSKASKAYRGYLKNRHDQLLAKVGASAYQDYTVALNGFAASLTAEQAATLSRTPGVVSVAKDALRHPTTNYSPEFLGLPEGLWPDAGGREHAGEGVIVGIVDTGIWPESPSFAGGHRTSAGQPVDTSGVRKDWNGTCVAGELFDVQDCNDKIIGARFYVAGFGKQNVAKEDYLSPRDGDGHGSHTASTAAGNIVEDVTVDGTEFGTLSGMAPAAQIAAYKVCWTGKPGVDSGCANSDSVAAIEDAVADGVDVINYSIGSTSESSVLDPVEMAFMGAAAAGVFVSVSAGNSGPGTSTLDHPSPWEMTVAASTFRISEQKLVLGNGEQYIGASTTGSLTDPTPMVLAESAPAAGVAAEEAKLCLPGTLDASKVTGMLVVCERGVNARIEKSFVVADAGGVGMVLVNPTPNSLNGDLHAIPSVHIGDEAYEPLLGYVSGDPNPTGQILPLAPGESDTVVPEVADFSSRGPSTTTGGDVLKPDISAPGVDVLAAVAPPFHYGRSYDLLSGTSMASPHIAGLGAVLYGIHDDWSPMAIKSALMTSAKDHATTNDPFDQGAGFVQPNGASDPGVVFDSAFEDWWNFLAGMGVTYSDGSPISETPIDPSDLNSASIAIGQLAGTQTVTRTLTNVSGETETYTPSADVDGVEVTFEPATVEVPAGESTTVSISFKRTDATLGEYAKGYITWSGDKNHTARMPVAVRPVAVSAPDEVSGEGTDGEQSVTVTSGFTGELGATTVGLLGATPEADSVVTGEFDYLAPTESEAADRRAVEVGEDDTVLRFDVDSTSGGDDLDLWVYRVVDGSERLVAYSATAGGDEQVTMQDPPAGEYVAYVHGFDAGGGGQYTWTQWLVGTESAGNLTVTPESLPAETGEPYEFTAAWSGLDASQRYLGWIGWTNGGDVVGRTLVSVN